MIRRLTARLRVRLRAEIVTLLADGNIAGSCCPVDHTDLDEHADTAFRPVTPDQPTELAALCRESWRRDNYTRKAKP